MYLNNSDPSLLMVVCFFLFRVRHFERILGAVFYANMTIFVNKVADKKEDSNGAPPEVAKEVKVCVCHRMKLRVG